MRIFTLFLKITTFTKTEIKFRVLKIFSQNFFAKYEQNVDMKNVQELNFCSKNDKFMVRQCVPVTFPTSGVFLGKWDPEPENSGTEFPVYFRSVCGTF